MVLWTIWLTANGAAGASGWALSQAASSSVIRASHSSSCDRGRALSEGKDPRGRTYFWLFEQRIDKDVAPDSDYAAIFSGAVSVTPLHLDPTHTESLNHLSHWVGPLGEAFRG